MDSAVQPPSDLTGLPPAAAAPIADQSHGFVDLPGNPPPQNAEVVWLESRGKKVRVLFAAEPKGGVKTRGTVWVCPGRTEMIEKYFEVARDLQKRGFAVGIFDWPGQGLSERVKKDLTLGHIRNYRWYVDAFRRGVEKIGRKAPRPHLVLAHSMGGTIALEAMRRKQVEVEAAAFSAPMWGLPIWFGVRWVVRLARWFGAGGMAAREAVPPNFAANDLTHDEKRWRLYHDLVAAEPKLAVGEPTIAWVVASLNVIRAFRMPAALDHLRSMPLVVATAQEDKVVSNAAQKKLVKLLKNAKHITIKGARHEILMELDEQREAFWKAFDEMCRHARI
jgi:lysophospholipase